MRTQEEQNSDLLVQGEWSYAPPGCEDDLFQDDLANAEMRKVGALFMGDDLATSVAIGNDDDEPMDSTYLRRLALDLTRLAVMAELQEHRAEMPEGRAD
jgi:hypothetical protein